MGLFKKIKKAFKKVVKGVKKVFKKVTKFVGKIAGSKWGKALLLASAVVTGGMALAAGFQGFTGTAGTFLTKFVAGAKEFVGALANPIGQAKKMLGGAATTTGQAAQAAQAAEGATKAGEMVGAAGNATQTATDAMGAVAGAGQTAQQVGQATAGLTQPVQQAAAGGGGVGGMLKKAAGAAWDFAKSDAGGSIISGMVKGYAEGKQQEELLKEQERVRRYYDNQWRDPNQLAQLQGAVAGDISVPGGYLDRARRVNNFLNERQYSYPAGAAPGGQVASYAVSPGG